MKKKIFAVLLAVVFTFSIIPSKRLKAQLQKRELRPCNAVHFRRKAWDFHCCRVCGTIMK